MHTENFIWVDAPLGNVFRLAAEVEAWPRLLPHYRWVRVLEEHPAERIVEMAARRGRVPVWWRSRQRLFPAEGLITYRHIAGLTRGMSVSWQFSACHRGTQIVLTHDLRPESPLLRLPFGGAIAGRLFVSAIADQTLHYLKLAAEREEAERLAAREQ
jgi:ribosome-associated toxin RatA of RatAB toxin-antitoxin module